MNLEKMRTSQHNLPVNIEQVLVWMRQCTMEEKKRIMVELMAERDALLLASEKSLAKDWLSKEDDEAWLRMF